MGCLGPVMAAIHRAESRGIGSLSWLGQGRRHGAARLCDCHSGATAQPHNW